MKIFKQRVSTAAEKYSNEQFAIAEARTVATYCNSDTFELAYDLGAHFGFALAIEMLRSEDAAGHSLENIKKPWSHWADWLEAKGKE